MSTNSTQSGHNQGRIHIISFWTIADIRKTTKEEILMKTLKCDLCEVTAEGESFGGVDKGASTPLHGGSC